MKKIILFNLLILILIIFGCQSIKQNLDYEKINVTYLETENYTISVPYQTISCDDREWLSETNLDMGDKGITSFGRTVIVFVNELTKNYSGYAIPFYIKNKEDMQSNFSIMVIFRDEGGGNIDNPILLRNVMVGGNTKYEDKIDYDQIDKLKPTKAKYYYIFIKEPKSYQYCLNKTKYHQEIRQRNITKTKEVLKKRNI